MWRWWYNETKLTKIGHTQSISLNILTSKNDLSFICWKKHSYSMWQLNLSSSALTQPVSIFRDVVRRNPVAANLSTASSQRRLLPETLLHDSAEEGMPCTLADDIAIILSLISNTDWIMVVTLNNESTSFTDLWGFRFMSLNLTHCQLFLSSFCLYPRASVVVHSQTDCNTQQLETTDSNVKLNFLNRHLFTLYLFDCSWLRKQNKHLIVSASLMWEPAASCSLTL